MFTQDELRQRRRGGLPVVYDGEFSLTDEISSICCPLGERAARQGITASQFSARVDRLADAVHELVSAVVGWLAENEGRRLHAQRLAALDSADRARAVRRLVDLAPRPPLPVVGPGEIASGRWATALVEIAEPYTDALAQLLARSYPPGDPLLRRLDSRSEKLVDLLREVDSAARQAEIDLDKAEAAAARRRPTPRNRAESARDELRALGIEVVS
jgi:hypothetical protein